VHHARNIRRQRRRQGIDHPPPLRLQSQGRPSRARARPAAAAGVRTHLQAPARQPRGSGRRTCHQGARRSHNWNNRLNRTHTARSSRFSTDRMIRQWPPRIQHSYIVMFVLPDSLPPAGPRNRMRKAHSPPGRKPGMNGEAKAMQPEDVTRLVAERLNSGDAAGAAPLYEPQAILAYPADRPATWAQAIHAVSQQMARRATQAAIESPLPTVRSEVLALTSALSGDNSGARVQVLRSSPDGCWLQIIDPPEIPQQ